MRIAVALLLLASSAQAAPLTFRYNDGKEGGAVAAPPASIVWRLRRADGLETPIQLTIPNVTLADEGKTFVVDATNAGAYGLDWGVFTSKLNDQNWRRISYGLGILLPNALVIGGPEIDQNGTLLNFTPQRLEFFVKTYRYDDVFAVLRSSKVEVKLIGDGILTPEPATSALIVVALMGLSPLCRWREQRSLPGRRATSL